MTPAEYVAKALRTEPQEYTFAATRDISPRIEHGVIGLGTEAGEMLDAVKKAKFYNKPLDKVNLVEEMGDLMWYLAVLSDELNVTFEQLWDKNISKLSARFPDMFTYEKAENRDLDIERKILEK